MDWVTLTKQQVENGALPAVCMVCGKPAVCCVNRTFSYTPPWLRKVTECLYVALIIPGVIAELIVEAFFTNQMRVPCPVCERHQNHWRKVYWFAGIGWLPAMLPLAGVGYLVAATISAGATARYVGLAIGGGLGLTAWFGILVYLWQTRIQVTKITSEEITFQGVADVFAKAVMHQRQAGNVLATKL